MRRGWTLLFYRSSGGAARRLSVPLWALVLIASLAVAGLAATAYGGCAARQAVARANA